MFLPCSRFNCRDNLSCNAQLGKGTERRQLIITEIPDGLVKANHAFLDDILPVCTYEEVGTGLGPHKITVLVDEIIKCRLIVIILDLQQDFLIREISKFTIGIFQRILYS